MPRLFTVVSIAVHALVIAAILVAQLMAIGPLPAPRTPLTFEGAPFIRVADIRLPTPHPAAAPAGATPLVSPDAAPTEAPRGITPEAGLEQAHQVSTEANGIAGIERAMPGAIRW